MGNQMTEMLKGTLEGIVLAILAVRPAYGYEITTRLREEGFSDLAEGTVYALLVRIEQRGFVDVEKVPSEKGPPRKVYSINAQGQEQLDEFWRTWSFLAERIGQLHDTGQRADEANQRREVTMAAKWIEFLTGSLEEKKQYRQYKARIDGAARSRTQRPRRHAALLHVQRRHHRRRPHDDGDARRLRRPVGARRDRRDARATTSSATTRWSSPRRSRGLRRQALDRQGARPPEQGDRRTRKEDEPNEPPAPAIQVKGLEKSYKDLHVLRGVDFDVAPGTIFALLGSNGAGKTTVVRILSTLLKQDAGTATVIGFDTAAQPQKVRESISLTGQFAAVDEILSGRENLVLDRPAAAPEEPRQDRGRPARPLLADRGRRPQGGHLLGRHAPPARHRDEPDRQPAGHLPRRADDGPRPPGAHRGVADGEAARRQRHHGAADDAVPR